MKELTCMRKLHLHICLSSEDKEQHWKSNSRQSDGPGEDGEQAS